MGLFPRAGPRPWLALPDTSFKNSSYLLCPSFQESLSRLEEAFVGQPWCQFLEALF